MSERQITTVIEKVRVLYGVGSNNDQRHEASLWLEQFQYEAISWTIADHLLRTADVNNESVVYYGAQTLCVKLARDFVELPSESLPALRQSLFEHLHRFAQGPASVRHRLCLAVAVLIVQMSSWPSPVADVVAALPATTELAVAQLLILTELPYECRQGRLNVSRQRRDELMQQLLAVGGDVVVHLQQLQDAAAAAATAAAAAAANSIKTHLLRCFASWLRYAPPPVASLANSSLIGACFDVLAVADVIASGYDEATFDAAADCVVELIQLSGRPDMLITTTEDGASGGASGGGASGGGGGDDEDRIRVATEYEQLRASVVPRALQLRGALVNSVRGGESNDVELYEEVAQGYTRIFTELGECYMNVVLGGSDDALALVAALLECAAHESNRIFCVTCRFWLSLSYFCTRQTPEGERLRVGFNCAFQRLLEIVERHITFPDDFDQMPADEQDEFMNLRKRLMTDVLRAAADVVGPDIVLERLHSRTQQLITNLQQQQQQQQPDKSWQAIEAALYCIRAVARTVDMSNSQIAGRVLQLLPHVPSHPRVAYTSLLIVGRYAEYLASQPDLLSSLFSYVCNTLLASDINRNQVTGEHSELYERARAAAAVSFNHVCKDCARILAPQCAALLDLHEQLISSPQSALGADDMLEVVEGIAIVTAAIDNDQARQQMLMRLYTPHVAVVSQQQQQQQKQQQNQLDMISKIDTSLELIARIVENAGSSRVSYGAWLEVWNILEAKYLGSSIAQLPQSLIVGICRCIRRSIVVFSAWYGPQLQPLLVTLVRAFELRADSALLHALSKVVEVMSNDTMCHGSLLEAVQRVAQLVFAATSTVAALDSHPDTLTELYDLFTALLYALADALVRTGGSLLPSMFAHALHSINVQHPNANSVVFHFLQELLRLATPTPQRPQSMLREAVIQLLSSPPVLDANESASIASLGVSCGERLAYAMLRGLAGQLPVRTSRSIARLIIVWQRLDPQGCSYLLSRALDNSALANLPNEEKARLLAGLQASDHDFYEIVEQFALACRRRKRWLNWE